MKFYLFIFCLSLSFIAIGQQDSVKNRVVTEVEWSDDFTSKVPYKSIDTILSKFYHYDNDGRDNLISLGNPGMALANLTLSSANYGFNFGENGFDYQFRNEEKIKLYKTNIPFARIAYLSGPKKFQNFSLLFTENIGTQFNLTVKIKSFGSDGFYLNQQTTGKIFSFQNSYKTRLNKYGYVLKFTVKSGSVNENGGIKDVNQYEKLIHDSKLGVPVWLDQLSTNRYDKRDVFLHQYFRIGAIDSLHSKYSGAFIVLENSGFVSDLWYDNQNADSTYYDRFNIHINEGDRVFDKSHVIGSDNAVTFKYVTHKLNFDYRLGVGVNIFSTQTLYSDSNFISNDIRGSFNNIRFGKYQLEGAVKKGITGYNEKGYEFKGLLSTSYFNGDLDVMARLDLLSSLPEYKYLSYAGNSIQWDNDFEYVNRNEVGLNIQLDSVGVEFDAMVGSSANYVYYNSSALPTQFGDSFISYKFNFIKRFVLKAYHFDVSLIYQGVEENAPVNIANWVWKVSFYYQRNLFKDAMELRYGIDYWQHSSYTANNYAPFTRSFVYQNEVAVGDYPFVNFYISARIKSAQGFVNFQNIGQLIFDKSYMMTPYYPMQDFGFSFGLRWDFYN